MANYNNSITYNSVVLNVTNLTPVRSQKTIKQIMGKAVSETKVLGLANQQWELQITGKVLGTTTTNLATNRAAIEALDVAAPYTFVDGIHNGTYLCVPGSLKFDDSGELGNVSYTYSMSLLEQ